MLRPRTAALVRGGALHVRGNLIGNNPYLTSRNAAAHAGLTGCKGPAPAIVPRRQLLHLRCLHASSGSATQAAWRQTLPFTQTVEFDGQQVDPARVVDLVVANRSFDVVPVVEGLFDMGNLAAVCRSADALGFGGIHVITKGEKYKKSQRTSAGADKWLHVMAHDSTAAAVAHLKARGFQLVVTHLGPSSVSIQDVDWTRPTAVVMGNEAAGVSEEMVAAADVCMVIPMSGFVESFNISVAAALVMYEARRRRQEVLGRSGDLSMEEQQALRAHLMLRALKNSDNILRTLLARPPPAWQEGRYQAGAARREQLLAALAAKQGRTESSGSSSSSSSVTSQLPAGVGGSSLEVDEDLLSGAGQANPSPMHSNV